MGRGGFANGSDGGLPSFRAGATATGAASCLTGAVASGLAAFCGTTGGFADASNAARFKASSSPGASLDLGFLSPLSGVEEAESFAFASP